MLTYNNQSPNIGVNYNTINDFDISKMAQIYSSDYKLSTLNYNYKSTYFMFAPAPTLDEPSPVPVMYLLTTWTTGTMTQNANSFASLSNIANSKSYGAENTFWISSIYGYNDAAGTHIFSIAPGRAGAGGGPVEVATKVNAVFKMLGAFTPLKAATVYFYLTPVYLNV